MCVQGTRLTVAELKALQLGHHIEIFNVDDSSWRLATVVGAVSEVHQLAPSIEVCWRDAPGSTETLSTVGMLIRRASDDAGQHADEVEEGAVGAKKPVKEFNENSESGKYDDEVKF